MSDFTSSSVKNSVLTDENNSFSNSETSENSSTTSSIENNNNNNNKQTFKKNLKLKSRKYQIIILLSLSTFFISLAGIFLILIIINMTKPKAPNNQMNKTSFLGLQYNYYEYDTTTGNKVMGTLYIKSDRLMGKSNEIKDIGNKIISLYNGNNEIELLEGSNKYDCTSNCLCENKQRRMAVMAYPIFQTFFAISATIAISLFVKNGNEYCQTFYEATSDKNKCEIDEKNVECVKENINGDKEFECSARCTIDASEMPNIPLTQNLFSGDSPTVRKYVSCH